MSVTETPTAPAEAPATPAPAAETPAASTAPVSTPAPAATTPTQAPAQTPEQAAQQKQMEAQIAIQQVIKNKEDACAAEIAAVCQKHGCELIVGHSVKVRFAQQG